ncbi:heterokaryon incompatibility protein-domain-containing protein [Nemania sp. NC0429]|nr:heterokaryon incompatibility protein-domain-containing protein [Nemania sp. NC0429]
MSPSHGGIIILKPNPYYNYTALPRGWIRLVEIQGDLTHATSTSSLYDDLHVTLHDYPLSSCPSYIALSYTWGEPSGRPDPTYRIFAQEPRCFPIHCGDNLLRGTRNLRDVLRRLRQAQEVRNIVGVLNLERKFVETLRRIYGSSRLRDLYWIDALCIDQDDLFERSEQVSQMGEMYKKTALCIVWLGEQDHYTNSALKLIVELFNNNEVSDPFMEMMTSHTADSRSKFQQVFNQIANKLSTERIFELEVFLSYAWFSRVWILQEVALAPKVAVQCGSQLLDFIGYSSLQSMTLNVMAMASNSISTDPRDRIYGVLALTAEFQPDSDHTIYPDYTLPVHIVYVKATSHLALRHNQLSFLNLVCQSHRKNIMGLPSCLFPMGSHTEAAEDYESTLWDCQPDIKILDEKFLAVDGFCYDVVHKVAHDAKGLFALSLDSGQNRLNSHRKRNGTPGVDSMWRLLIRDQLYDMTPAPKVVGLYFPAMIALLIGLAKVTSPRDDMSDWRRMITELRWLDPESHPFLPNLTIMQEFYDRWNLGSTDREETIQSSIHWAGELASIKRRAVEAGLLPELKELLGLESTDMSETDIASQAALMFKGSMSASLDKLVGQCFFVTGQAGRLGLGSASAKTGVEVWILHGASKPVLLRPLENGNYEFLGATYVHGIMGDGIKDEFRSRKVQRVCIE